LSDFKPIWVSRQTFTKSPVSNFTEFRPKKAAPLHADRQTHINNPTDDFRDFKERAKKSTPDRLLQRKYRSNILKHVEE